MNPIEPEPKRPQHITDHLANERTFLAWVRTALGLIGLGFVLARMGLFLQQLAAASLIHEGKNVRFHPGHEFLISGVVFLVIGTVFCAWAGRRYGENRRAIDHGNFLPARSSIHALTALVVTGGLVIAAMVIWRTLFAYET